MNWKKIAISIGVADLIVVNGVIGYLFFKSRTINSKPQIISNNQIPNTVISDGCGEKCQKYIDDRFKILDVRLLNAGQSGTLAPTVKPAVVVKTAPKTKVRSVAYVSIPGSGSAITNTWTDIPGTDFYFDPNDYSGLVEVYFEANARLFNGNGMAYIRLFDTDHGIGIQGSDVQTNSQVSSVVTSGKVSFWAGKNLIRVQAKSLTADTAIYDSGRLRIVTEN